MINPHTPRTLTALHTPFGKRALYDSAAHCTRCGCCQQACPSYALKKQETFSPRGRNQLLRLVLERKLDPCQNARLLENSLRSCTLCGRCSQTCAGKIPTAEHMLELRRMLRLRMLPGTLQNLLRLRGTHPTLFKFFVRTGLILRRLGFIKLLCKTGLARLFGFGWLTRADELLPKYTPEIQKYLSAQPVKLYEENPSLVYLPSLEAEFFMPELAAQTLQTAAKKYRPVLWSNTSSGLFEYVYGDLQKSRRTVRRLINRLEKLGNLPLLTDSIDVFTFFKRAPQLFSGNKRWEEKARRFAARIKFVTDLPFGRSPHASEGTTSVRLDCSALFSRGGGAFDAARKILKTQFKKNFVECLYTDADTPAFGYGFVKNNLAQAMGLQAVRTVAQTQSSAVFTLSGLAALELDYLLRRFYPNAKAKHVINLHG